MSNAFAPGLGLSIPTGPAAPPPSDGPALSPVQSNSGHGSTVTYRDGVASYTSHAPLGFNSADIGNGHEGILSTARNSSGGGAVIAPSAIKPESFVTCEGIEMQAATAERLGYLVRNPSSGLYEAGPMASTANALAGYAKAAGKAPEDGPQDAGKAPQGPAPELFEGEAEANYQAISKGTLGATQATAMRELTTSGTISPHVLGNMAAEMGIEPAAMAQRVEAMRSAFAGQAQAAFRGMGVDPEVVLGWAHADPKGREQLGAVVREHMATRSTRGYAGLLNSFLADLPARDPEMAMGVRLADGATVRRSGNNVLVHVPSLGTEVSFAQAFRHGLVKLAR